MITNYNMNSWTIFQQTFLLHASQNYFCIIYSYRIPQSSITDACHETTGFVLSRFFGWFEDHHRSVSRGSLQQCWIACVSTVDLKDVLGYRHLLTPKWKKSVAQWPLIWREGPWYLEGHHGSVLRGSLWYSWKWIL